MMKRAICIIGAVACIVLLSHVAALAQVVNVDNGVAAEDYLATGPAAGVTTGIKSVTIDGGGGAVDIVGNAGVTGGLAVGGTTTLSGAVTAGGGETVLGGASLFSGTGAATDNNMIVNGTGASIGSEFSGLSVTSATNAVSLISDTNGLPGDQRTALTLTPTTAQLSVNTDDGVAHGIFVDQTKTIVSGGSNSTTLTLDDTGATFADSAGGPALVHGVADGRDAFDAVNVRQLGRAVIGLSSGIASVAALAAIPGPVVSGCKYYSLGLGYGHFGGQNAGAIGLKGLLPKSGLTFSIGGGFSENASPAYDAGIGFSF